MSGKMNSWHEQDEFWSVFEASIFDETQKAAAPVEVESILRLLAIESPLHICDLCCGVGRHSLELARRGFTVTAVDRTACYLNTARDRALAMGVPVEFLCQDMRDFRRPEAFDVVLNLFTSFGYFESPDDDRRVLENIRQSLKPGGRLLIDVIGKEILARIFRPRDWHAVGDTTVLYERKPIDDWSRIENRWILVKDGHQTEWRFSHRIYAATELRRLLEDCGFDEVTVYGNFQGALYDEIAERLVIVGRRGPCAGACA